MAERGQRNGRLQWCRHYHNGRRWQRCNGRRDDGAIVMIVMFGITIAVNGGGGDGQQRQDGNTIGSAMVVQLQWATAAVAQSMVGLRLVIALVVALAIVLSVPSAVPSAVTSAIT
jgi:hypothetical protein